MAIAKVLTEEPVFAIAIKLLGTVWKISPILTEDLDGDRLPGFSFIKGAAKAGFKDVLLWA